MKVYSLYCAYWSAGDWNKGSDLNCSVNPTESEILGVYLSGSEAIIAMNEIKSDPDYTLDLCVYESYDIDEKDIKEYLIENELTLDDIHKLTVGEWTDIATRDELMRWDIDCRIIEQESKKLYGDEIIISWEYYRYVGYARKFHDIYTAQELGFEKETDLATGNEESTFRMNFSILLTHEEVEGLTEKELEEKILEALEDGSWKWTYDSDYKWVVNMKFGTNEIEEN